MFVKPANLGSSVGISKAKDPASLEAAMDLAGSFDRKIVVEAAVAEAREIECAVLGNDAPSASVPGEVVPSREFYDYEAKYIDDGSKIFIPADLPAATAAEIQRLSVAAFQAIDCAGLARVDFLLERATNKIYVNEVNTIPGFTTISMYSKLWAASGVEYRRAPRSIDRARPRAAYGEAAAAHQRHMIASPRRAWLLTAACATAVATTVTLAAPSGGPQRRGRQPSGRGRPAAPPPAPDRPALIRGEESLARAYDFILDARFDQVDAELRRACGPAPPEACDVLSATALWWQILIDPLNRSLDDEFSTSVDRAIRTTEDWTERAPDDAEAWFYLGGAYAARVQWRVLREERLAAARDGKRIKQALERAIELSPGLEDAYFGIGLYQVLRRRRTGGGQGSAVLPDAAWWGQDGRARADAARAERRPPAPGRGGLSAPPHLPLVRAPTRAGARSAARPPEALSGQSLFPALIADIQDTYQHDVTASLDSWRALLALAREQRVNLSALAETQARLGAARQLEVLQQTDHAIELLEGIVSRRSQTPYSSLAPGVSATR